MLDSAAIAQVSMDVGLQKAAMMLATVHPLIVVAGVAARTASRNGLRVRQSQHRLQSVRAGPSVTGGQVFGQGHP